MLDDDFGDLGEEDGPGYHPLAVLLRARMGSLPEQPRPPAAHGDVARPGPLATLEMLAKLADQAHQVQAGGRPRRTLSPTLPAKRKKSDEPAPIYQIKVSLTP